MQNKTYKTISLFSGYLGLDIGVSKAIGEGELVGWSDIEPGPLALGSHHAPKARRLGDITKIDWEKYKDIEVMAGGFCCQSLSLAGFRAGLKAGTRSGLWLDYAKGIGIIRPSLVVAENVAGLLSGISVSKEDERMDALRSEALDKAGLCSCEIPDLELPDGFEAPDPKEETSQPLAVVLRGFLHADPERCSPVTCRRCGRRVFEVRGDMVLADDERLSGVHTAPTIRALGRVLGDLANLGYDAVWRGLEAADIGAPHHRLRIFVTAWPRDPKSAREPSNARLRRLAQLPPMRPRGRAWGVWDADRDVWTTGEPDLFGDVDVFMDAWPKSGVMAAGRVYTVPESWLKVPEPAAGSVLATPKASDGAKGGPGQAYGTGDAPLPAQAAGSRPTGSCTRRSSRTGCSPPRPRRGARWTGARSCPRRCVSWTCRAVWTRRRSGSMIRSCRPRGRTMRTGRACTGTGRRICGRRPSCCPRRTRCTTA